VSDIFDAVESGEVSRGVIPFENSTNGSVVSVLDLFADLHSLCPSIIVCGETYVDIHHYLLGNSTKRNTIDSPDISGTSTPTPSVPAPLKTQVKPLASLRCIERIYSHPQAFGQCDIFLEAYLKGVERIDVSSTSKAAEKAKLDTSGTSAAIASQVAADVYELDVLAKGIEDSEDNTTRFFILKKNPDDLPTEIRPIEIEDQGTEATLHKSLVSFTVDHKVAGALADVLDCFRQYKLNLTSINSRPSRITPFQYIFFVEFEGSMLHDFGGTVHAALNSLGKVATSYRWLGSWENKREPRL
jgi:prephenate dehydratase